jgi:NADPH-dependent glutamate synthase beta subunit-like oxidoreductase
VLERELEGIASAGIRFQYGRELGADITVAQLEADYEAVFLAPGLWSGRRLEIAGSEKTEITDALSLLTAFRDTGKADVGKNALVIGGGSVACDAAITAKLAGADRVRVVCLEPEEEMPALRSQVEELRQRGVDLETGWGPKEINPASTLCFVCCTSVFDAEGRFSPRFDESETVAWEFDQLILAVGQTAEPPLARYLASELGYDGRLSVDEETLRIEGRETVFAGGDIIRGAGTAIQAAADGRRAAAAIHARLGGS